MPTFDPGRRIMIPKSVVATVLSLPNSAMGSWIVRLVVSTVVVVPETMRLPETVTSLENVPVVALTEPPLTLVAVPDILIPHVPEALPPVLVGTLRDAL